MIKLIQNIDVYAPEHLGLKDVLVINDKIVKITDAGSIPQITFLSDAVVIDGTDKILTPGFIDCHVIYLAEAVKADLRNGLRKLRWKGLRSLVLQP